MTLLEKINSLTWYDLINKLKDILKGLAGQGGDSRPYKVYTALLTQSGTDAPVATVLENTLGVTPVWSYIGTGHYRVTANGSFTIEKRQFFTGVLKSVDSLNGIVVESDEESFNEDFIQIKTLNSGGSDVDVFTNLAIEIRVYN